jgi:prophage antirepressor-like protein
MSENLPQVFIYQQNQIRTVMVNGEPWFVASDICEVLGLKTSEAVKGKKNRNYEDGIDKDDYRDGADSVDTLGGVQKVLTVSEGGLYDLIFKSRKPEAKPFKKWVTHELIPTIRKTGAYITDRANPVMLREKASENEKLADVNILAQTLLPVYSAAGMKPEFQLMAMKQFYEKANIDIPTYGVVTEQEIFSPIQIAAKLGMCAGSGKPHNKAVLSIISKLEILPSEKVLTPYENKGHTGTTYQYTASVIQKVKTWLDENNYPAEITFISGSGRIEKCHIVYKTDGRVSA